MSYYNTFDDNLPESIRLTKFLIEFTREGENDEPERQVKPIPECILSYYISCVTDFFAKDNISYEVQVSFELGYDPYTNRITIPIRDEIGTLVGVKGRLFKEEIADQDLKYVYIEPCAKSHILYGLYKALPWIKHTGVCYVGESEKSVLQMATMGYCNAVGCGGKKLSRYQIEKLSRLCCDIVLLFDKDVDADELQLLSGQFIGSVNVYAVIDTLGILESKESPTDNPDKFKKLIEECKIKLR